MTEPAIARILSTRVVCRQPGRYIGWPTITKTRAGELLVVFSGDRDAHFCPWGKTQVVRSADGGLTWSDPATMNNTPLDDRDAGIIETAQGTLLVSWFTALGFTDHYHIEWQDLPEWMWHCWNRHAEKLGPRTRQEWLGSWVRRSTDGGAAWEDPIRVGVSAPHGPIQLRDGRLLYVGTGSQDGRAVLGVERSRQTTASPGDGLPPSPSPPTNRSPSTVSPTLWRSSPGNSWRCFGVNQKISLNGSCGSRRAAMAGDPGQSRTRRPSGGILLT